MIQIYKLLSVHIQLYFCLAHIFCHLFKSFIEIHARSVPQLHLPIISIRSIKIEVNWPPESVGLVDAIEF